MFLNNVLIVTRFTDSSGNYSITGLAPDSYVVRISATSYQTAIVGAIVQADQTTTANAALQPNPGTVSGIVTDATTGLPIANTVVEVNLNNVPIASTLTDSTGTYIIPGIAPGSYVIHAHNSQYQTGITPAIIVADQTTTVNFSLTPNPGTVTGTVTDATTELPLAGVLVELNVNDTPLYWTLTDSTGTYTITGAAPGTYVIHAHATNYQIGIQNVTIQEGQTSTVNFALVSNPGTLTGLITDAQTGLPISGAIVQISLNGIIIETEVTDNNGTYTESSLPPGNYVLIASKSGYNTGSATFTINAGQTVNVHLALVPFNSPARNLVGTVICNQFLLQTDRIHQLQWQASIAANIIKYNIYRNDLLIGIVFADQPLLYQDHNRCPNSRDTYKVTAVNRVGYETSAAIVVLQ